MANLRFSRLIEQMTHVLTDLFFIAVWAALLSISFNDYFTSPAVRIAFSRPS